MHTRSCLRSFSKNLASFELGLVAAKFQVTQATVAQGGAGTGSVVFVVLTVAFSTGAEAKIVLMRFAAEPLFLFETKPCRPVKFASFLRTGRRETFGNVVFARRPRRVVRRLVALDGAVALAFVAVALAASGGCDTFVVAAAGAAPVAAVAAALLGVLPASGASLDDVAPAAASQKMSNRRCICSILTAFNDPYAPPRRACTHLDNRPSVHVTR